MSALGLVQGASVTGPVALLSERIISSTTIKIAGVALTIAEYVTEDHFGAQKWRKNGVNIPSEPAYKEGFEAWWFGPDPVDPSKCVCDTHLPPVAPLAPESSLQLLMDNGLKFYYDKESLRDNKDVQVETPCWLIMRRDFFARNEREQWQKQKDHIKLLNARGAGYEEEPNPIHLATVLLARNKLNRERHLGDDTDAEMQFSPCNVEMFSRCILNGKLWLIEFSPLARKGIVAGYDLGSFEIGVSGLRQF
jgi:hypothetical protein